MRPSIGFESTKMLPEHLDGVMAIERTSYGSPWTRNMFLEEMSKRISNQLVFYADNQIIGYICYWNVVDESHVLNIAVHPDARRQGYGEAIMRHLEVMCKSEGIQRIVLDVGKKNLSARALYKKQGFKVIGFRKNYYPDLKDDALVMEKHLDSLT